MKIQIRSGQQIVSDVRRVLALLRWRLDDDGIQGLWVAVMESDHASIAIDRVKLSFSSLEIAAVSGGGLGFTIKGFGAKPQISALGLNQDLQDRHDIVVHPKDRSGDDDAIDQDPTDLDGTAFCAPPGGQLAMSTTQFKVRLRRMPDVEGNYLFTARADIIRFSAGLPYGEEPQH